MTEDVDVAIVGGGPAGLAAATELARAGGGRVVVLEREAEAGGIPRHARHQGFGLRDLHRVLAGPAYAARWAQLAADAGAELRTGTQVTGWVDALASDAALRLVTGRLDAGEPGSDAGPGTQVTGRPDAGELETTGRAGRRRLRARAVVLATGCRERPRSARLVAGTRPQGVMTTGMLQQLVHLRGEVPGRRAVVVGAEHVSFSALLTLAHGGASAVALVTEQPRHQSYALVRAGAALRFGTPLLTRTAVTAIHGRRRVEAVEVTDLHSGVRRELACDLVVFTADWIPEHELAVLGGIALDPGTRGPVVDAALRTSRAGVFAAGNVLHGAETADVAALGGRHVSAAVLRHLRGEPWPAPRIPVTCAHPLHWIAPNALGEGGDRFLLRAQRELVAPRIEVSQDGRRLWAGRLPRVMPGRSARLATGWVGRVDRTGGAVAVRVVRARAGRRGG